ncbi:interferon regulatory factor 3 isoform X3 [Alligator mississippiensis]|uniref:Interferon regulatory factor 3 isoform B n=2 Tax=Alligator mississippiensis TaxID=8496 RepID=A0A151N0Z2_ALLMI|nr:interferon regulatory factor 3 isoform X3 [Alligator mississippiensis]KYO30329.1 interferon regulatory factor 3 isoform B [Alligator mississippiensis]
MGSQRPLLVPWLREQLDSGCYPGVCWLNAERTRFRVPWKHGLRHDAAREDFQLFQVWRAWEAEHLGSFLAGIFPVGRAGLGAAEEDWATVSGCYHAGTAPVPSIWKRNFRSALNRKPEFKVVEDNSSDATDPHKVYEILPVGVQAGADEAPLVAGRADTLDGPLEQLLGEGCSPDSDLEQYVHLMTLCSPEEDISSPDLSLFGPGEAVGDAAVPVLSGAEVLPPLVQPLSTPNPGGLLLGSNELVTDFDVNVYYRGHRVLHTLVSSSQGLRLVFPQSIPSPAPELMDVVLPDPESLPDRVQANYTGRLLRGLGPGVVLRAEGRILGGCRLGRCHAFWGRTATPAPGALGGEIPKESFTPLYSLPEFIQDLIGFMEGQRRSPDYELWLCLGEKWPDTERPWNRKLIMVQVVLVALQKLHELSQAGGASSLRSSELDLHISDSLGDGGLLGALRSWEELMDTQP